MARYKEPRKRFTPLAVLLGAFALIAATLGIAAPAEATGNQGTIKVHALGSEPGTESNEPKVCAFNLEFYNFVEGFSGYVKFDVQGGDGPTGVAAGPFEVGTANADGYFESQYFNVEGGPTIQNGHYKVTLYGKFNGAINYEDVKAKSKVFKVDCQSTEEPPPPPPYECPAGTVWTDTDGDGKVDEGECNTPPPPPVTPPVPPVVTPPVVVPPVPPTPTPEPELKPVKVVVKKADKCGTNNSYYVKPVKGAHVRLFGKKVREGVWLDTKRSRLVLKAKVDNSKKFELVGKGRFVLVFGNDAPCHDTPDVTPPAGG